MQTIFRTPHTSNYTITPNALINDESLSAISRAIQLYLVSKPPSWRFNANDIKRAMGIGLNKVYRHMRELIAAGYARYVRGQSKVTWYFYDTPMGVKQAESTAVIDRVNFECVKNECVLERNELLENKEIPLPSHIEAIDQADQGENIVVVIPDGLIYPEKLTPVQRKACKAIIKKVKAPTLQQPVLFALAHAMTHHKINSVPAYLNGLVTRANDGTFEPVAVDTAVTAKKVDDTRVLLENRRKMAVSDPVAAKSYIDQIRQSMRGVRS